MKITPEIKKDIQLWIDELRSGKWKQGKYKLQSGDSFCCLGVACKLFIHVADQKLEYDALIGPTPSYQNASPPWLINISEDLRKRTGEELINLNDNGTDGLAPFTFDEISDLLQAVYIEEVLG